MMGLVTVTDDLTPGVLDGAAQRAFLQGACPALAFVIHQRTGWPQSSSTTEIITPKVTDADGVYPSGSYSSLGRAGLGRRAAVSRNRCGMGSGDLHWGCLHPMGLVVDVEGLHPAAEMVVGYDSEADGGKAAIGLTDEEDLIDEYVTARGAPVPFEVAESFVDAVLGLVSRQVAAFQVGRDRAGVPAEERSGL